MYLPCSHHLWNPLLKLSLSQSVLGFTCCCYWLCMEQYMAKKALRISMVETRPKWGNLIWEVYSVEKERWLPERRKEGGLFFFDWRRRFFFRWKDPSGDGRLFQRLSHRHEDAIANATTNRSDGNFRSRPNKYDLFNIKSNASNLLSNWSLLEDGSANTISITVTSDSDAATHRGSRKMTLRRESQAALEQMSNAPLRRLILSHIKKQSHTPSLFSSIPIRWIILFTQIW